MCIDRLDLSSAAAVRGFVEACEAKYSASVTAACERALRGGRIITLAGPTCSGKTTSARILDDAFLARGKELHTISIDDFYLDRAVLEARARESGMPLDYDSPSTIDLELFGKVVRDIDDGGTVTVPRFDFQSGTRTGFETFSVTDDDVFLFEGIQAVYPELTAHLAGHGFTALFISVDAPITVFGETFAPETVRFLRRLVRDARTRGASAEFTFSLWGGVLANEQKHIYPNLGGIDCRISSGMDYELSVIKPFATALLASVPSDSPFAAEAAALAARLAPIPAIDASFVPQGSVFREFIGE